MTAVLVHGNPETPAIWGPLVRRLGRDDVVTPQLPGFGVPAPPGFGATKEEYTAWLVGELEGIGEPVDLVGHDWGGGFVIGVAMSRPDLIRTWVSDLAGVFHPNYVWHDFAQLWVSDAGEQWVTDTVHQPVEERAALMEAVGIHGDGIAAAIAGAFDEEMGRCILALYRSAAQPAMVEWGRNAEAAAARPGLVVAGTADPFAGGTTLTEEMATRMGARFEGLEGLGHFWMTDDPDLGARTLTEFWASV